jgi:hypothetical protein
MNTTSSNRFRLIGKYFIEMDESHPIIGELIQKSGIEYKLNKELTPETMMVLVDTSGRSIYIWEKTSNTLIPNGIECVMFWNESTIKSESLIRDASYLSLLKWGKNSQFALIPPNRNRGNISGYYSFKAVGWKVIGRTKDARFVLRFNP